MQRAKVNSSNLQSVGYDSSTKTLEVEFSSGEVFQYHEVPPHVFQKMSQVQSIGSFFHSTIRGHFKYTKMSKAKDQASRKGFWS